GQRDELSRSRPYLQAGARSAPSPPRAPDGGARYAGARDDFGVSDMAKKNKKQHTQASGEAADDRPAKLKRKQYEGEMRRLHGELVAMQEWVKASGAKLCIVF